MRQSYEEQVDFTKHKHMVKFNPEETVVFDKDDDIS